MIEDDKQALAYKLALEDAFNKYNLGLALAIQEIEEYDPNTSPKHREAFFYLTMYRKAVADRDKSLEVRAARDMLSITGRGYLKDRFVQMERIPHDLLHGG